MRKNSNRKDTPGRRRVTFRLHAPEAQAVFVTGEPWGWVPEAGPLKRDPDGNWTAIKYLPPGRYEYRFVVDGEWTDDPACPERVSNEFGTENCVLRVGSQQ